MYGTLTKARWRTMLWHKLSTRADKSGWVISLAGRRFQDRRIAERYGFTRIMGVDTDRDIVRHNADHGRILLESELSDVIYGWNEALPISVINADYCGNGGSAELVRLTEAWLMNPACRGSYLALNVSVGRERGEFLEWMKSLAGSRPLKDLNRAYASLYFTLSEALRRWLCHSTGIDPFGENAQLDYAMQRKAAESAHEYLQGHIVDLTQYKARKVWMDGAIIKHDFRLPDYEYRIDSNPSALKARRHIAAKRAWMTRTAAQP